MQTVSIEEVPFETLRQLLLTEQMPAKDYLEEIERRKPPKQSRLTIINGGKD